MRFNNSLCGAGLRACAVAADFLAGAFFVIFLTGFLAGFRAGTFLVAFAAFAGLAAGFFAAF